MRSASEKSGQEDYKNDRERESKSQISISGNMPLALPFLTQPL